MHRMHRQVENHVDVEGHSPVSGKLVSTDPSTGEEIWSGEIGDAAAEVAAARAAWPAWAAHSNAFRIEAVRRFANVVRKKEQQFAELIFAPQFNGDALEVLSAKPNVRILEDNEQRRENINPVQHDGESDGHKSHSRLERLPKSKFALKQAGDFQEISLG